MVRQLFMAWPKRSLWRHHRLERARVAERKVGVEEDGGGCLIDVGEQYDFGEGEYGFEGVDSRERTERERIGKIR